MSDATLFHVVVTREEGSFPVSVLGVARGGRVAQESADGIDVLSFSGDDPGLAVHDAVSFVRVWNDLHGDGDASASLLVRVPNAYDRHVPNGVGELAHVGEIDQDGDVTLSVSDSRVWEALNGVAVRFA